MTTPSHHQILIIGGGAAGITVAASLQRKARGRNLDIAIVEPSEEHYYQPAFTLVGAGTYQLSKTCHAESTLIPPGVTWIKDAAASFNPDNNSVTLAFGDAVTYDYLVVCPGLELNWEKIDGLNASLGSNGELTVLGERSVIAKIIDVFPGRPVSVLFPASDGFRTRVVECRVQSLAPCVVIVAHVRSISTPIPDASAFS